MSFTEKDIQDYLDGNFEGDVYAMKEFLSREADARETLEQYQVLYKALKDEEVPSLSCNLADTVVSIVEKRKDQNEKFWSGVLTFALITIGAAAIIIGLLYFDIKKVLENFNTAFLSIAILLSLGFLTAFKFVDVKIRRRKFGL
jgi:hypothetical protein